MDRASGNSAGGCHAVRLFVGTTLCINSQVTRRFISPRKPGTDHDVRRTRRERKRDIAWVSHSTVGPDVLTKIVGGLGALKHRRKLRPSNTGLHPGRTHGAGTNTHLDDVGSRGNQVASSIWGNNIARHDHKGMWSSSPIFANDLSALAWQ